MIQVTFGNALQRHVACPPMSVEAATVAEALQLAFRREPRLRGYLLDDQGVLRKHMALFVNGAPISDRQTLADPLSDGAEVMVIQALSGG